jgi:hypothetical protein
MPKNKKDWFDTHVKVMTLDDNLEQEKKIHEEIKKACIKENKRNVKERSQ